VQKVAVFIQKEGGGSELPPPGEQAS